MSRALPGKLHLRRRRRRFGPPVPRRDRLAVLSGADVIVMRRSVPRLLLFQHRRRRMMHMHLRGAEYAVRLGRRDRRGDALGREGGIAVVARATAVHGVELDLLGGALGVAGGGGVGAEVEGGGAALDNVHELVEDNEFEAELEAVDGGFEDGLDAEEVGVFGAEEGGIEDDDEDVDPDQVQEDFAGFFPLEDAARGEDLAGFPEVEAGDDDFLDGEAGHLDFFVDRVDLEPFVGRGDVGVCLCGSVSD